jgi:hypothetical protein
MTWTVVTKANRTAVALADDHYSRQTPGSREIGPPGQKLVLLSDDQTAVWGSHRPAPWVNLRRMDGFEGHSCFIFRNTGPALSSILIREAVAITALRWGVGPFITYVAVDHVRSTNPGFCFVKAGFTRTGYRDQTKLGRMARLEMDANAVSDAMDELANAADYYDQFAMEPLSSLAPKILRRDKHGSNHILQRRPGRHGPRSV